MSAEEKVDVDKLTQEVQGEIDNDAHTKIARLCRTVLASKPDELLWLRLLCCAMIHQSQTRALLQLIESYAEKKQISDALLFYKIYCLYLLKENESAHALLDQLTATPSLSQMSSHEQIAIQHLRFQILYRLARYDEALQVLNAINDSRHLPEVAVNKISTYIAMQKPANAIAEYYTANLNQNNALTTNCDFVFNLSTALIIDGQTDKALPFLLASQTKCESAMQATEEYDEDEIAAEIGNLQLLIAYCYHECGETDKAAQLYQTLIEQKVVHGVYQNLVLQNNALVVGIDGIDGLDPPTSSSSPSNQAKKALDPKLLLYKKLLCGKNTDNFSRIAVDKSGVDFLLKAYHNQAVIASRCQQDTVFKAVIGFIRHRHPLSEIPICLKVSHWFNQGRAQQCRDVLFHHLSTQPNASSQCKLLYIQALVVLKKYRDAIQQLRLLLSNDDARFTSKMMRILLLLSERVGDAALTIEIMQECIAELKKTRTSSSSSSSLQNQELLVSLQIRVCRLMIAKNQAADAKEIALSLFDSDPKNKTYRAMVLLTAIHAQDMALAEKMSADLTLDIADDDGLSVDEMLSEVPRILSAESDDSAEYKSMDAAAAPVKLSFEFTEESVLQRKREVARRKRAKIAGKIRQKYKEHPELYKEPVDWRPKKVKERAKRKENKSHQGKDAKTTASQQRQQKKNKGFKGAQGGSVTSDHYQVFDIGDPRNKKTGKQAIPEHIKKRKR
mmetsp:Transcript_10793/g.16240  ORF Transcript_10793/g.16240 Transcript_10793/m.16240 type:complete len:729 (+) Transcript_10793:21-2207(+)